MIAEREELEHGRARVRLVAEQEVEHGRQLRRGLITAAVGHRAVGELEQQLEAAVVGRLAAHRELLDQLDHRAQPLEPAAHVEEAPAEAARHVLQHHAVERGQVLDQPIQEPQRVVRSRGPARAPTRARSR